MKAECQISIIVPVFNVQEYLSDCLDSLLTQDLAKTDYEIICINDGSQDASQAILEEYAKKHENLCVISQEHTGVSAARNAGLEAARGEYVAFVDADDYIKPCVLGYFAHLMQTQKPDVLQIRNEHVPQKSHYIDCKAPDLLSCRAYTLDQAELMFSTCCGIIVRKSLIDAQHLRFVLQLTYGEDTVFAFSVWQAAERVLLLDQPTYCYRARRGSAVHRYGKADMSARIADLLFRARLYDDYLQKIDACSQRYQIAYQYQKIWSLEILNALLLADASISDTLEEMERCHMPFPKVYPIKKVFEIKLSVKERIALIKNAVLIGSRPIYLFWVYLFRIFPIYRWGYRLARLIFV
ncbi:MAG: glycosyltransferase [Clostridia bacterium]|nr:glycosyltransferase [Clostridia bacterium]